MDPKAQEAGIEAPPSYNTATDYPQNNQYPAGGQYPPPQAGQYPPPQAGQYPPPGQYPPQQTGQYPPPPPGYYQQQPVGYQPVGYQHATTTVVTATGQQPYAVVGNVPDNSGIAWFSCLCCFWPLGLLAIMKSQESKKALAENNTARAFQASAVARRYAMISIGLGLLLFVPILVFIIINTNI